LHPGLYDINPPNTASGLDLGEKYPDHKHEVRQFIQQEEDRSVEVCALLSPQMDIRETYIQTDSVDKVFGTEGPFGVLSDTGRVEDFLEGTDTVLLSGELRGLCTSDVTSYLEGIGKNVVKCAMFPEHQLEREHGIVYQKGKAPGIVKALRYESKF
jgi:hypothetical protein